MTSRFDKQLHNFSIGKKLQLSFDDKLRSFTSIINLSKNPHAKATFIFPALQLAQNVTSFTEVSLFFYHCRKFIFSHLFFFVQCPLNMMHRNKNNNNMEHGIIHPAVELFNCFSKFHQKKEEKKSFGTLID